MLSTKLQVDKGKPGNASPALFSSSKRDLNEVSVWVFLKIKFSPSLEILSVA